MNALRAALRRLVLPLAAAGALLCAGRASAAATTTSYLNLDVTITSALSVKVDGVASSTYSLTWTGTSNQAYASNALSSITVTNDTGILNERWLLSTNANSLNTAGRAATWTVAASSTVIGADAFALQAVFGSALTAAGGCLAANDATWNDATAAPLLSASQKLYTSARFVGATLTAGGGSPQPDQASGTMFAGSRRALCWRLITPDSTSTVDRQNVQILVTATP